jgi:DNA primase
MPHNTPGWKVFSADRDRPGEEMHDTLETEEAALGAACRALHPPPGRDPEPVLRIEGPNGERISLEEIEEYCRRISR